jgi:hypothetical protein|tara:strand:+ start:2273 stop:2638 length:366 start_codon:yes stop_codon:yes gene_type:complete
MANLLGKGVGSWTANDEMGFSNFSDYGIGLGIERSQQRAADRKEELARREREIEMRLLKEQVQELKRIADIESNRESNTVLPSDSATPLREPTKFNYQPYLLYGGIGLVIIVGGFFIFPRN